MGPGGPAVRFRRSQPFSSFLSSVVELVIVLNMLFRTPTTPSVVRQPLQLAVLA